MRLGELALDTDYISRVISLRRKSNFIATHKEMIAGIVKQS